VRVSVTVVPNARATRVDQVEPGHLRVAVTAPPREGRANDALVRALAAHFGVPRSRVRILRGAGSRHKIVEIADA
jgi:hypothetical protein